MKGSPTGIQVGNMMRDPGLIDIWQDVNGTDQDFTFLPSPSQYFPKNRLFLYLFGKDRHRIRECIRGTLILTLNFAPTQKLICIILIGI